jgi:hypothetical protein
MTLEEALEILGLASHCDQAELTRAFHTLSKNYHPDINSESGEYQLKLNEARDIVSAYLLESKALVPLQVRHAIQKFENTLSAERAARQVRETASAAKVIRARPLQKIKYLTLVLAAFAVAVGWFGENILPNVFNDIANATPNEILLYQHVFKGAAFVFGAASALLQLVIQRQSLLIEQFVDNLDDAEVCAKRLAKAVRFEDRSQLTQDEIAAPGNRLGPITQLLVAPDPIDAKRILVLKSIEHGLLKTILPMDHGNRSLRPQYEITIRPSEFGKPPPEDDMPSPKDDMLTTADAGLGLLIGCLVALGLLLWLAVNLRSTWWVWLPSILAGMVLVGSFGVLILWIQDIKRNI